MLAEGGAQVLHQAHHVLLVLAGEVLVDVELTHSLAEHGVWDSHGAFPAGFLLLGAGHDAVVEFERGVVEVVAEHPGAVGDHVEDEVVLELLVCELGEHLVKGVEEGGGGDV